MHQAESAIVVKNLVKNFGRKQVLKELGFSVPLNTIAGFLGPNGAGKTTTLRMLLGLIPGNNGEISMLGHVMPHGRTEALEKIGAVVENPTFIESMTACENLFWFGSLYKPVTQERILEVIEMVGLKDAARQRFGTFSTGMKQRLGVAFGILHRPRLLILDEPTSGMDPAGRVHMREILTRIHKEEKTSIFLSSHLLDEVQRLCSYVVIIDGGRTVKEGYVAELLADRHEKWEVRIADEDIGRAGEIVATLRDEVVGCESATRGLILTMNNGCSAAVNAALIKGDVKVNALIPLTASLEDTFIKLTGSSGESAGGAR
jgi:ABC-2 type transport system ATP-binding protein